MYASTSGFVQQLAQPPDRESLTPCGTHGKQYHAPCPAATTCCVRRGSEGVQRVPTPFYRCYLPEVPDLVRICAGCPVGTAIANYRLFPQSVRHRNRAANQGQLMTVRRAHAPGRPSAHPVPAPLPASQNGSGRGVTDPDGVEPGNPAGGLPCQPSFPAPDRDPGTRPRPAAGLPWPIRFRRSVSPAPGATPGMLRRALTGSPRPVAASSQGGPDRPSGVPSRSA